VVKHRHYALTGTRIVCGNAEGGGAVYDSGRSDTLLASFRGEMNMEGSVECIRCHAHMESGWLVDNTHGAYQQQNWPPGEPQPSFWTGLQVEKDQVIPVTTLRCPNCG